MAFGAPVGEHYGTRLALHIRQKSLLTQRGLVLNGSQAPPRPLDANPGHPDAPAIRAERDQARRRYLTDERGTLGWGVFVGRSAQLTGRSGY